VFLPIFNAVVYPYRKFGEIVATAASKSQWLQRLEKRNPEGLFLTITMAIGLVSIGICYWLTYGIFSLIGVSGGWTMFFLTSLAGTYVVMDQFSCLGEKSRLEFQTEEEYREYLQGSPARAKENKATILALFIHITVIIIPISRAFR
jgi:hypothetical protein